MKQWKQLSRKNFLIIELILLAIAAFFEFALLGFRITALLFVAIAVTLLLYYLLSLYRLKNEKRGKLLTHLLTILLCLGVLVFTIAEIPVIQNARTDSDAEAEYVIVLGAGVNGTEPSLSLSDRLTAAEEYLNEYPNSTAILSGGRGEGEEITEASCMKEWLVSNGISENRLIEEDKSTSTIENLRYSLDKIEEDGGSRSEKIAIVSAEYHLYRAKYFASELGCNSVGVAAKTSIFPLKVNYFIREAIAVLYIWIM